MAQLLAMIAGLRPFSASLSGEDETTSLPFSFDLKGFVGRLRRSQEGNIFHQQMNG